MTRYAIRYRIAGLLTALLSVFLWVPVASAEEVGFRDSITLSPTTTKFQVSPGESKTGTLTVINDGETDYNFLVYARPYSVQDEQYTPEFTKQLSNTDAYSWVQFDQVKYHVNPGASLEISFRLNVPAKASPGGHYGVIFAETQPQQENTSSIVRKKRVGSLLYVTVKGDYNMKGSIAATDIALLQFRSPLGGSVTAKNEGNSDFTVTTTMRVSDPFGRLKYEASNQYSVLPDTTRKIPVDWANSPWFGIYKVEIATSMLENQTTSVSAYVLIAPRWLLIFVGVLIVGGIGYAILRRYKQ